VDLKVLAVIVAVAAAACVGTVIATADHDGADLEIYASDGLTVDVSGDLLGNTVIKVRAGEGTEFDALYTDGWKLLSEDGTYTGKMKDGSTVYAFSKTYFTETKDAAFDIADLLDAQKGGTVSASLSDFDMGTASVDGTEVTCNSFGLYRFAYAVGEQRMCASVLSDGVQTSMLRWNFGPTDENQLASVYDFGLNLDILYSDYRYYSEANRDDRYCYTLNNGFDDRESLEHDASFVNYGSVQDKYLTSIASYISSVTQGKSQQYVANIILFMTQYLEYEYDDDIHGEDEYWQYPLETLFLGSGDCEDTTTLFCAVAGSMGLDTCMFIFNNHAAGGVRLSEFTPGTADEKLLADFHGWEIGDGGILFYYAETTSAGWFIGDVPKSVVDDYAGAIPLSIVNKPAELNIITSPGIETFATATLSGDTVVTASVPAGGVFAGWFDSEGGLLTSDTTVSGAFKDGDTLYAVTVSNTSYPIKSGTSASLPSATGHSGSGTWKVYGATGEGTSRTFPSEGIYLVTCGTWAGAIYAFADVIVFLPSGASAEVTAEGLNTNVTVTLAPGKEINGIFRDNERLCSETSYSGNLEDGDVLIVLESEYFNADSPASKGQPFDLEAYTGMTSGTWKAMDNYFNDVTATAIAGTVFTAPGRGTYVAMYESGDTRWCGMLLVEKTGFHTEYDVTGRYSYNFFNSGNITGEVSFSYLYYNQSRNAYYMEQDYTFNYTNGSQDKDSVRYWTDDDDPDDYMERNDGTATVETPYGTSECDIWLITYTSSGGYAITERQYISATDELPYKMEISFSSGGTVFRYLEYTLMATSEIVPDIGGYSITVYSDPNVTETHTEPSAFGDMVSLEATVSEGSEFLGWFNADGELVSDEPSFTIGVDCALVLYARSDGNEIIMQDVPVDISDLLGVSGPGTISITNTDRSPADISEVTLAGTEATFLAAGNTYYVVYDDDANGIHTHCVVTVDRVETRTFEWSYGGEDYSLDLDIHYLDYAHYVSVYPDDRSGKTIYSGSSAASKAHDLSYVHYDDVQTPYIKTIADYITSHTTDMDEQSVAAVVLRFCQSGESVSSGISYVLDNDTHGKNEYWQFPLETLYLMTGDCEDTSILYAAIMSYMGYDACLFLFTDHMAVGIALESFTASGHSGPGISSDRHSVEVGNTDYYYCETTNRDWCIGDVWSAEYPLKFRVGLVVPQYS